MHYVLLNSNDLSEIFNDNILPEILSEKNMGVISISEVLLKIEQGKTDNIQLDILQTNLTKLEAYCNKGFFFIACLTKAELFLKLNESFEDNEMNLINFNASPFDLVNIFVLTNINNNRFWDNDLLHIL